MTQRIRKLWGGRFVKPTDPVIEAYTSSIRFDWRLAPYDIQASIAHARMLAKQHLIAKADANRIVRGLQRLLRGLKTRHPACAGAEDIHSWIQATLEEEIGSRARLLQTGRSRNDQVVASVRLYCRDHSQAILKDVKTLAQQLLQLAKRHLEIVIPGYTHLRRAQPVLFAHHLAAYLEMLERDRARIQQAMDRMDELPLGSGALTGIGLAIDQRFVAKQLGFARIAENSMDAVSDRDFVIELVSALAILTMHLSRLAEDLILWSTQEFGFLSLDESVLTGSSLMPQKQNPDALELIRGSAAKLNAELVGLLALEKGLPLGYHRDLQRDKEFLFDAVESAHASVKAMIPCLRGIQLNPARIALTLRDPSLYATDLADYLIRKRVPVTQAHEAVGRLIRHCAKERIILSVASLDLFRRFDPHFDREVFRLFQPTYSVSLKQTIGGTAPQQVRRALRRLELRL